MNSMFLWSLAMIIVWIIIFVEIGKAILRRMK